MRRTSWAGVRRVAFFRWKNIIGGDEEEHGGSCDDDDGDVEDYVSGGRLAEITTFFFSLEQMGRGQKAPQGRLSSSTCEGPKKLHDSLISKYFKTAHFHELSQRCQPSHGWTIIHISLPTLVDKWDGWMCRTMEAERQFCKKRAGGDGPADIFKYFEPNK